MDAAILAGGLGTRLQTVVGDRPKVLAEVGGRPYLTYLLDQLAAAGVKRVVLCTGYRGEQVRDALGDDYRGMKLEYSVETTPLGTAGALRLALDRFRTANVLVMNGDSYCDADLPAFAAEHENRGARASLVLAEVEDAGRFGSVHFTAGGAITRFEEKSANAGRGWINAGIYLIDVALIESIPTGRSVSLEREVFPGWIGHGFFGHTCRGAFLDIGTPASYAAAEQFFAQHAAGNRR